MAEKWATGCGSFFLKFVDWGIVQQPTITEFIILMRPQHIYPILFSVPGLFNPQKLCCLYLAFLPKRFLAIPII